METTPTTGIAASCPLPPAKPQAASVPRDVDVAGATAIEAGKDAGAAPATPKQATDVGGGGQPDVSRLCTPPRPPRPSRSRSPRPQQEQEQQRQQDRNQKQQPPPASNGGAEKPSREEVVHGRARSPGAPAAATVASDEKSCRTTSSPPPPPSSRSSPVAEAAAARRRERRPRKGRRGKSSRSPSPRAGGRRSVSRSRSRSGPGRRGGKGGGKNFPSGGRKRDRSRSQGRNGPQRPRRQVCWYGWDCRKKECWFAHPDGRRLDGSGPPANRRGRGRSPSAYAPRSSPSRSPVVRRQSPPPATRQEAGAVRSRSSSSSGTAARSESPKSGTPPQRGIISFREFVLDALDDKTTCEEAVAIFTKLKEARHQKLLERFKTTGLYSDLYNPLATVRRHDMKLCDAQRSAQTFLGHLRQGRFDKISLQAPASKGTSGTCTLTEHMQAPEFAFDADADSLFLGTLPAVATTWEVHDALAQCPGFVTMGVGQPAAADLSRELRARFASTTEAQTAAETLSKHEALVKQELRPRALVPALELKALVVPPEMSHPDRIQKDEALAARAVRHLDGLVGIPQDVTDAVLNFAASSPAEMKLDLKVLYLRRVHHFCFYSAVWCHDEWALRDRCGPAVLRCQMESQAETSAEGEWSKKHEERMEKFLTSARLDRPRVSLEAEDSFALRVEEMVQENTDCINEARFQCKRCNKLFKGLDFIRKHLRKVHVELFETVFEEILQEASCTAYNADAQKPDLEGLPVSVS